MTDRHAQRPYPLRISDELRARLESDARASGRSLNAEIVQRLDKSVNGSQETDDLMTLIHQVVQRANSLGMAARVLIGSSKDDLSDFDDSGRHKRRD